MKRLFFAGLLMSGIHHNVGTVMRVDGQSMQPTLNPRWNQPLAKESKKTSWSKISQSDYVYVDKTFWNVYDIKEGDIVVFRWVLINPTFVLIAYHHYIYLPSSRLTHKLMQSMPYH